MRRPIVLIAALALAGCDRENAPSSPSSLSESQSRLAVGSGRTIYALDADGRLLTFTNRSPGQVSRAAISGIAGGESLVGLDIRPANGALMVVGLSGKIYTVDPVTAVATPLDSVFAPAPAGLMFGMDFNPVPDRIRLHSDAEQNLRLNPVLGNISAVDTALAFMATDPNSGVDPSITGTAYTNSGVNNGVPPTTTTLYAIDSNLDVLVTLPSPNSGQLRTVGALGVNSSGFVGFDIFGGDNLAYAALTVGNGQQSRLYRINLATGAATLIGDIGTQSRIVGLTVSP